MGESTSSNGIDASKFQKQLSDLARAMSHLVERELPEKMPSDRFLSADLTMLLRQSVFIVGHMWFLYAQTYEDSNPVCLPEYGFATLSGVRVLIDSLYNVIALLERPGSSRVFRADGYRQILISAHEAIKNAIDNKTIQHYNEVLKHIRLEMRSVEIAEEELIPTYASWPTIATYLNARKGEKSTTNSNFLRQFGLGLWRDYSAISHATFQGLTMVAGFYVRDRILVEDRPAMLARGRTAMSLHLVRACFLLLCIVAELQLRLQFDGARVNERIREIWSAFSDPANQSHRIGIKIFEDRYILLLRSKMQT